MARIVALSSLVARGHVGLRALVPALETFGHDVAALPTILLSNHAGSRHVAGAPVATTELAKIIAALEANGWLASASMIVTGYLPKPEHVDLAVDAVARLKALNPAARFVCDPVLGDTPRGLYLPAETADRVKERLLPLADVLTPNAFELCFLTGLGADSPSRAVAAAHRLGPTTVFATSVPVGHDRLATVLVEGHAALATTVPARPVVPHGTGDLLTGLIAGLLARGAPARVALPQAGAILKDCIDASAGSDDLDLATVLYRADMAAPLGVESIA